MLELWRILNFEIIIFYLILFAEESKGGVKFEVVLSQPVVDTPPRTISPTHGGPKPISVEVIENKLKQAAERRQVGNNFKLFFEL